MVASLLPAPGVTVRDLGSYRFARPARDELLFHVVAEGLLANFHRYGGLAPLRTGKAFMLVPSSPASRPRSRRRAMLRCAIATSRDTWFGRQWLLVLIH
jgi:hypothetical protein